MNPSTFDNRLGLRQISIAQEYGQQSSHEPDHAASLHNKTDDFNLLTKLSPSDKTQANANAQLNAGLFQIQKPVREA
ncbi:MAG: hypothetical protein AAFX93_08970 [Verrucomicrobiota bacterium]